MITAVPTGRPSAAVAFDDPDAPFGNTASPGVDTLAAAVLKHAATLVVAD